jgi:hypothetical protein
LCCRSCVCWRRLRESEWPSTPVWQRLFDEDKLKPPQTYFRKKKPAEELYDLQADHDEVNNLVASAAHKPILERFRKADYQYELEVKDVGLLPEGEMHAGRKTPRRTSATAVNTRDNQASSPDEDRHLQRKLHPPSPTDRARLDRGA